MVTKENKDLARQQFVTFTIAELNPPLVMALNVQKIKEVVEYTSLSSVPSKNQAVLGVYNLRGAAVPVLDIRPFVQSKLQREGITEAPIRRLLICDLQRLWIGIPVFQTGRIFTCNAQDFLPPPEVMDTLEERPVSGLIRREDSYIPVLDLDSFLASAGLTPKENLTPIEEQIFKGKRVLLVEDSRIIQKRIALLFTKLGFSIATASNGEEALRLLEEKSYAFDLIFTDIEMPVVDGITFARKVKETPQAKEIPILFNSALSNPALIADIEKENLGRYLVKFDEELILKQLSITLNKTPNL